MINTVLLFLGILAASVLAFCVWCCLAINTPRTEEGKRRAFKEDCEAFDACVARNKGGEHHAERSEPVREVRRETKTRKRMV